MITTARPRYRRKIRLEFHPMWWLVPTLFAGIAVWVVIIRALLALF